MAEQRITICNANETLKCLLLCIHASLVIRTVKVCFYIAIKITSNVYQVFKLEDKAMQEKPALDLLKIFSNF